MLTLFPRSVVLDRYFLLLDIFNLGEIDVQNLLLGAEDFARLVVERRSPSLADLLQTLRRPSESLLLASETELKGQALDFRRKWKKALRDLSWEVKLHKADVKKLERCEATIEAMAQEKGHLWARCLRAESERARLETVVGGLEAAGELCLSINRFGSIDRKGLINVVRRAQLKQCRLHRPSPPRSRVSNAPSTA